MKVDKKDFGLRSLHVTYHDRAVGTLAKTVHGMVAFEYDDSWLSDGFAISPFSLPLKKKVFLPEKHYFNGLFGIFADSLPDAWGQLLLSRMLQRSDISEDNVNAVDRLAVVGSSGMGALCYHPDIDMPASERTGDLDRLSEECSRILNSEQAKDLDLLFSLGGTSGGARPKIMTEIDGEKWIIKFPANSDIRDIGKMEYDYSLCAGKCSIDIPATRLFPSEKCSGYFGIKRFDSDADGKRVHMATAAALLEADFRQPCLDYHQLMKLTAILTGNDPHDMENMFRRACFNVFAHNRDDHAKNFSFLYDDSSDSWKLSPAYDLTYSTTYYGEHTTSVDGNGKDPGASELLNAGTAAGLAHAKCRKIIKEIEEIVRSELGGYIS